MKTKLLLLVFCITIFAQGCASIKAEVPKMEGKTAALSDFTKVQIGMTYEEVINLMGEPTNSMGSGIVWQRYNIDENWYIKLLFSGEDEILIDMRIVDYPSDREFVLKQGE